MQCGQAGTRHLYFLLPLSSWGAVRGSPAFFPCVLSSREMGSLLILLVAFFVRSLEADMILNLFVAMLLEQISAARCDLEKEQGGAPDEPKAPVGRGDSNVTPLTAPPENSKGLPHQKGGVDIPNKTATLPTSPADAAIVVVRSRGMPLVLLCRTFM